MTNWTDYVPVKHDPTLNSFNGSSKKPSTPPSSDTSQKQQQQHQETNNHHSNAGWHPSRQHK